MRQKITILILFLVVLLLPSQVSASSDVYIKDYYVDATVESSGDIYVKELFLLTGDYNGYERIINYRNVNAKAFDGTKDSFEGSDIYNGTDIELLSIRNVEVPTNYSFDLIRQEGELFQESQMASSGMRGVYQVETTGNGYRYRIYNPSNGGTNGFMIEYRLKDMAILHSDIAEIGWNLFTDEQADDIEHFLMKIHLPENKNELRAWAHGPLNGNISLDGKNLITVEIDDLRAGTPMDVRFAFDKDQAAYATKTTGEEALPMILEVEEARADQANQERMKARVLYYGTIGISIAWLVGLIFIIIYIYYKYDREYQSTFPGKYFRDFPSDDTPATVGYLFNKKIRPDDLSACIMNLIEKKVLKFEENPEKKNDYILTYIETNGTVELSPSELQIVSWLFDKTPGNTMTLSQMKKDAKKDYEGFYQEYTLWKTCCESEAKTKNFFEKKGKWPTFAAVYAFIGFLIGVLTANFAEILWLPMIVFITAFAAMIYFLTFTRRTKEGNELYAKWKGLRNFLNDFGKFETKDLPQIALWGKYLVYAMTFGCADKLMKTMQIKVQDLGPEYVGMTPYYNYHYMNSMLIFNRTMNRSVNSAVNTAISTRTAAMSSDSSGGGFGGGFSSGGGSFGGGGGGGHF